VQAVLVASLSAGTAQLRGAALLLCMTDLREVELRGILDGTHHPILAVQAVSAISLSVSTAQL
jgi:hypothetical protein